MMTEVISPTLDQASSECNLALMKTNAIMEAAIRELEINKESAELKVMRESGTNDDLLYYYEAAENGFVQTVVKIIKQVKNAIIKFCSDIKTKILTIMGKKENIEVLDKVEKKIKFIPFLKKKKILVEDYNAEAKCTDKAFSELNKLKVKAKAGQSVDVEDVKAVKESFISDHKALIGVGAAITITLGAAIAALKTMNNKSAGIMNDLQKRATDACDDCIKMAESIDNPKVAQALSEAIVEVSKTGQEDYIRSYNGMLNQVKRTVRSVGKTEVDIKGAKDALNMESTDSMTGSLSNDAVIDDKEVEKMAASSAKDVSEMGDDPECDIPVVDDEPDTDPWDDVMNTDVELDQDEMDMLNYQSSNPCNNSLDDDFEGCGNNTEKCGANTEKCGSSNESGSTCESDIDDIFNDIMNEVYESENQRSEYESLMSEIENLV